MVYVTTKLVSVGAEKYLVETIASDDKSQKVVEEIRTSNVLINRLRPGTWYDVTVLPVGEKGRRDEESSAVIKVKTSM